MGNWNINIQGVGCHHNSDPKDANRMTEEFAEALRAAGHHVESATFTYGGKQDITPKRICLPLVCRAIV